MNKALGLTALLIRWRWGRADIGFVPLLIKAFRDKLFQLLMCEIRLTNN
jgi:hypothetical protein